MATETHTQKDVPQEVVQDAEKDVKTLQRFWTKFNNDWVMNFASGLAFSLLTAIFPIVIAIISITGLVIGGLAPGVQQTLITNIEGVFPQQIASQHILQPVFTALSKNAGFLGIIAILTAVFGGSRLFITIEQYFDIIYHTRPRDVIPQNVMAILMLLLFIILIPLMIVADSGPALFFSLLQATPLKDVPGMSFLFSLGGFLGGLLVSWILFEAIYIVVPNQHISFRNSWRGALFAAIALQIYLTLFPFYATHFLSSYTGTAGFAVILLFFFYYFAVILLAGAEINAFFAEHVRETPDNLAVMVHNLTSHLPTSEKAMQQQAAPGHKDVEPKTIRPKSEDAQLQAARNSNAYDASLDDRQSGGVSTSSHREKKASKQKGSTALTIVEATAGTLLAFVVQFFQLRRKK